LNYCRNLKFEEKPDIGYLRKLFKDLFYRMGYEYDFVFDWMVKKQQPGASVGGGSGAGGGGKSNMSEEKKDDADPGSDQPN